MSQKYLIGDSEEYFDEDDLRIVWASSEEEALDKYINQVAIHDKWFLNHIYMRAVNAGYAEHFWLYTQEEINHFSENAGELLTTHDQFKERVREFFGEHTDFADLFLQNFYHESEDYEAPTGIIFPPEMRLFMYQNKPGWTTLSVMKLDDIKIIK